MREKIQNVDGWENHSIMCTRNVYALFNETKILGKNVGKLFYDQKRDREREKKEMKNHTKEKKHEKFFFFSLNE